MTTTNKTTKSSSTPTSRKVAEKPVKSTKNVKSSALEMDIFSQDGSTVGKINLPDSIFNAPWRADLVHQVTTAIQANLRQNRAHTKDRSEVSGGGKKPWKQKGTGRARHGSIRSPLWRHGGVTFGPRNERNYSEKINRKMRIGALISALSQKARDGEIILVDKLAFDEPKTSVARKALTAIAKTAGATTLVSKSKNSALLALTGYDTNVIKSFNNFGNIVTEESRNLNPLNVLSCKYLIIEKPEEMFKELIARTKAK